MWISEREKKNNFRKKYVLRGGKLENWVTELEPGKSHMSGNYFMLTHPKAEQPSLRALPSRGVEGSERPLDSSVSCSFTNQCYSASPTRGHI